MNRVASVRLWADRAAITLSTLCAIHCLALPVAVVLLPALAATGLADEAFHTWMVFAVLPISAVALVMGCSRHRSYSILLTGLAGMLVLLVSAVLGHDVLGEVGERGATLLGSVIIVYAHWRNYRLCQSTDVCELDGC